MKFHTALGALVIVQLLLAAITWWPADPAAGPHALLAIDRDSIETIEVVGSSAGDAEPQRVELARKDGGWVIRSAADYPATPAKVDELLDNVLGLNVKSPIATRDTSHNALNVGAEEYGRRVKIGAAGEITELVLGAATSRSVNVRREGEPAVYHASGASEFSFRESASSYYDTSYVEADLAKLAAVSVRNEHGELRFEKSGDRWTILDLDDGQVVDPEKIDGFLRVVTRVRMVEPAGEGSSPEFGLDDGPRIDWTVSSEDQSSFGGYRVGSDSGSSLRHVKAVDHPFTVKANRASLDRLTDAKRDEFLVPGAAAEAVAGGE